MNTHDKYKLPPLPEPDQYTWYSRNLVESIRKRAIEPYKDEIARLQRIIDSRPAINAGLPQTYIEWSHSIYQMEAARALEVKQ